MSSYWNKQAQLNCRLIVLQWVSVNVGAHIKNTHEFNILLFIKVALYMLFAKSKQYNLKKKKLLCSNWMIMEHSNDTYSMYANRYKFKLNIIGQKEAKHINWAQFYQNSMLTFQNHSMKFKWIFFYHSFLAIHI